MGTFVLAACASQGSGTDTVTGATVKADASPASPAPGEPGARKHALIVLYAPNPESSTAKVAHEIARALDADVVGPDQAGPEVLAGYELIGFASGIFDQKHHSSILEAAEQLPGGDSLSEKRFILISTSGVSRSTALRFSIKDPHDALRQIVQKKRGVIVGEFNCPGLNKNSVLKYVGGMNRGRPNAKDLDAARVFASEVLRNAIDSP